MRPHRATFMTSASGPEGFPPPTLTEVAFAGRSNVGKSSLINALCGVDSLARTSRTPGRTRLLNWFRVEPGKGAPLAFVDLPGYGYARVPREMQREWRPLVDAFLVGRPSLRAVLLLVDARRGAEDEELDFVPWLAEQGIPVEVIVTKSDKLGKAQRQPVAVALKRALGLARLPHLVSVGDTATLDPVWRAILRLASATPPPVGEAPADA